jgi:hypothetical protein
MKKSFLLLLFLFCICLTSTSQSTKLNFSYAIFLGSDFEDDTVSIKVNNVIVSSQYVLTSRRQVNMVMNFNLRQTAKGVIIFYNGKETILPKVKHSELLNVELIVNGHPTRQQVNLKNGQILLFNYSSNTGSSLLKRRVTLEQHKEPLIII